MVQPHHQQDFLGVAAPVEGHTRRYSQPNLEGLGLEEVRRRQATSISPATSLTYISLKGDNQMKVTYLAIFTVNDDRSFTVQFHDVPNAITEGKSVAEAVEQAKDVLGTMLCLNEEQGKPIPDPSPIDNITLADNQLIKPVTVDLDQYRHLLKVIDGNPIRYAREQKGLNIKELADYLGAPYRTVQDWNSGKNRPPKWCEKLIVDKIWAK